MVLLVPLSLPLALAVAGSAAAAEPHAAREPPDHPSAAPKQRVPSPQCRACCESKGASCGRAYMGSRPGICCAESHTCCPIGTFCVKQGQRCALQPEPPHAPPPPPVHAGAPRPAPAPAPLPVHSHPVTAPPVPAPAPLPAFREPGAAARDPGGQAPQQSAITEQPSGGAADSSREERRKPLLPTSLQTLAARAGSPSLIQVILGAILVISLVFCCTAVFCLRELCDCLFGASGGTRVAPGYAGQQQFIPAQGMYPGQYPGQYQGGPYSGQYPAQY